MYSFCRVIEINEPSFLVGLLLMATDEIKQMSNQLLDCFKGTLVHILLASKW